MFASTSMFVSCSYEEDIATLRTDVTDLTSLVNSKMQAVEAEIDALGSQTETLEAAYEDAMEAIANADAEAKEAAQANAAQIAAAMELINSAVADLQAAFDADVADLVAKDAELTSAITAAQAKAEQASALVAELKTVVEALQKTVENLEKQMTILGGKVSALEEAAQKNAAAIEAQAKIVAELQKSTGEDLAELEAAVEAAKAEAAAAAAEAKAVVAKATAAAKEAMTADLDALKTAYAAADAKLANDIKVVKDSVDALAVKVDAIQKSLLEVNANLVYESKRLKSLVFAPTSYIDGVECINFVTLKYNNWENYYKDAPNGSDKKDYHIDDSTTTIEYLVNPENVLKNDIVGLSFISNQATNLNGPTRAVSQNAPISVKSFEINNGVMGVQIYKNNPTSFGSDRQNFTIVSLKATLSDKFLTDEEKANGEKAEVYSDWARLRETSVRPYIHNTLTNKKPHTHIENIRPAHFWRYSEVYTKSTPEASQMPTEYNDEHIADSVVYTESIDLLDLVEVCDSNGNHFDPAAYGLEFRFKLLPYKLANEDKTTDFTDQKHFAKLNGTILTSTARDNVTEKNRDAIGRQPMIQVALWDKVNQKTVDVRYFKIKWIADTPVVEPEEITVNVFPGFFGDFTKAYGCAQDYTAWILEEQVNKLYTIADENGMSRDEFHNTYALVDGLFTSLDAIKTKVNPAKTNAYGTFLEKDDASGAGQTWNYNWTISTSVQKMTMQEYLAGKKVVTAWGYFVNKKNSKDRIAFQLQFTWTISRFGLADGYNRDQVMWANNLRHINPALDSDTEYGQNSYHGVTNLFETTQIVGSLLEGYIKNGQTPYDVTEMVNKNGADAKWVFDEDKLTGHLAGYSVSADGSKLMKGLTTAATVDPIYGTIQLWESNNGAIDSKPSEPSKYLVGKTAPVKIVASWCSLTEEFEHHDVKFLTPLEFKSDEAICELYDITSGGYSAVTFADKFEIREIYTTNKRVVWDNKKVNSKTNEDLVEWYQVSKVIYDVKNAKTNITKNGQIGADCTTLLTDLKDAKGAQKYIVEMGYDANGNDLYEVWFYNKSGDAIGQEFKIEIPVKVTTKWQDDLKATIKVTVKPSI